jgi:hypothetical protein
MGVEVRSLRPWRPSGHLAPSYSEEGGLHFLGREMTRYSFSFSSILLAAGLRVDRVDVGGGRDMD